MCLALADNTAEKGRIDEVAIILSFLPRKDIMRARQVCTTWRDAAMKTIVPPSDYVINSLRSYNAMRVMATALPKLQQLSIFDLGGRHIYYEGIDPDVAAETANYHSHDLNIISSFTKLRALHVNTFSLWRCPVLFDFPLLESLIILNCIHLKWTLDMLEGLQLLKALKLYGNPNLTGNLSCLRVLKKLESVTLDDNPHLTGNLSSLRALKDTLEKLFIRLCPNISGNFMDLADFQRLEELDLVFVTSVDTIFQLWKDLISQRASMVVCVMSLSSFLTCLVSL